MPMQSRQQAVADRRIAIAEADHGHVVGRVDREGGAVAGRAAAVVPVRKLGRARGDEAVAVREKRRTHRAVQPTLSAPADSQGPPLGNRSLKVGTAPGN